MSTHVCSKCGAQGFITGLPPRMRPSNGCLNVFSTLFSYPEPEEDPATGDNEINLTIGLPIEDGTKEERLAILLEYISEHVNEGHMTWQQLLCKHEWSEEVGGDNVKT